MLYNPPTGGAANDPYVGKNVAAGRQGSKIPPTVPELTQREIVAVIAASGQTPTNTDSQQMLRGVRSGVLEFYADAGAQNAPAIAPQPAHTALVDGLHLRVRMKFAPTGPASLAINTLGALIQRVGGAALVGGEWAADDVVDLVYSAKRSAFQLAGLTKNDVASQAYGAAQNLFLAKDGSSNFGVSFGNGVDDTRDLPADTDKIILGLANGAVVKTLLSKIATYVLNKIISTNTFKQRLSGNLDLWVRSDGNDSNDGRANTAAGAFAALQAALNTLGLYDFATYTVTIHVGQGIAGTYAGLTIGQFAGNVVIAGDPANPTGTVIVSPANTPSVINLAAGGPALTVRDLILDYTYNGIAPVVEATVNAASRFVVGPNVTFRCNNNRANLYEIVAAGSGASVLFGDGYTVSVAGTGSRASFMATSGGASMSVGQAGGTVYFKSLGTITYTSAFALAQSNSSQNWTLADFGQITATGNRASADGNAVIQLGGKTLPGSSGPGTPTHGAQIY